MRRTTVLSALALLACSQYASAQVRIDSVTPSHVSAAGGTRLELRGQFSMNRQERENIVYVGDFPCSVIDHYTTDSLVTCETSAGDVGSHQVTVLVPEQGQDSFCCVNYDQSYTPSLLAVRPSAGPPGTHVSIIGRASWRIMRDCRSEDAGPNDESCVGEVVFGDYLCNTGAGTDDASSVISGPHWRLGNEDIDRYDGWNLYNVSCTLPDPSDGSDALLPGLSTAGSVNVSLHFEASLRGGTAEVELDAYRGTREGAAHLFQMYADITSVTPSLGSEAGGTELVLEGRGFPDLSLDLGDTIEIEAAGSKCHVLSSNFTHVVCATGPKPENYAAPPAIEDLWPGMRGIEMEVYMDAEPDVDTISNLGLLNDTITVENAGNHSFRVIETGAWETPLNMTNNNIGSWCSKSRAFFTAPTTGDYRFFTSMKDYATLHGSWIMENGTAVSRQELIRHYHDSPLDDYHDHGAEQRSDLIYLTANSSILLEAAQCADGGDGWLQVAVLIPSSEGTAMSVPEVQKITVSGDSQSRSQVISYLSGTGTDDIVRNVTVTAPLEYSWMLAKEYPATLTFMPSLNGSNLGADFNISVVEDEDSVRSQLAQALGADQSDVGVLRWADTTTVIYQIGVDSAKFPGFDLGVEVTHRTDPAAFKLPPPPSACTMPPPPFPPPAPTYPPITRRSLLADDGTTEASSVLSASVASVSIDASSSVGPDTMATWFMGVDVSSTPQELPFNATVDEINSAIHSLVGFTPENVDRDAFKRGGGYLAHQWTIRWPWSRGNDVPDLFISPSPDTPSGHKVMSVLKTNASTPIQGEVEVAFGDGCDTVKVDLNAGPSEIAETLGYLESLAGRPLRVFKESSNPPQRYGYAISVHFDTVTTPGNLPMLRIAGLDDMTGDSLRAQVTLQSNGSTDIFLGPIPTELLSLPVSTPHTLAVNINRVPTACANPSGYDSCTFGYDSALTPNITDLSTTTLEFASDTTAELTISGSGFNADPAMNRVMLDDALCNITSASETSITCFITDDTPGGTRELRVYVDNLGYAQPNNQEIQVKTAFVADVSPKILHANAGAAEPTFTMVTVMGKGFDPNCTRNALSIGDQACGIVSCDTSTINALFPGIGSAQDDLNVTVMVMDKQGVVRDMYTLESSGVHQREGEVPSVSALLSPSEVTGAGTTLMLELGPYTYASNVTGLALWPGLDTQALGDSLLTSYADIIDFRGDDLNTSDSSRVSDTSPILPNAVYRPVVYMADGRTLVSNATVTAKTAIASVSPAAGSIGGGTLMTINGEGFSEEADENVVVIEVPVSTSFLNGLILCDVVSASSTQLTCRTRAHLAAQASASDPTAQNVRPVPTDPGKVQVVICNSGNNDALKFECWSDEDNARSTSEGDSCTFEYASRLTPVVESVSPATASAGEQVTISGQIFGRVVEVQLRESLHNMGGHHGSAKGSTDGDIRETTTSFTQSSGSISFTVPQIPAGKYTVTLRKFDDELSVAGSMQAGELELPINISDTANFIGSTEGGNPFTVSAPSSSIGFNTTHPEQNTVHINGVPCEVDSVTSHQLTCIPGALSGRVLAEYWELTQGNFGLPEVDSFSNPDVVTYENSVDVHWYGGGPAEGINKDHFASRFTFYFELPASQNYTFYMSCDDDCALFIDGTRRMQASYREPQQITLLLGAGQHAFMVTQIEHSGHARVKLHWGIGNSIDGDLPWHKVTPVPSGSPMDIRVAVNGAVSRHDCPSRSDVQVKLASSPDHSWEPPTQDLPGPACQYLYSAYRTPHLTEPLPSTISSAAAFNVTGLLLAESTNPADYMLLVNGVMGSTNSVEGNTTHPIVSVNPPALPAGEWKAAVRVAGFGNAAPADLTITMPSIRYSLSVGTPVFARGSFWGGLETEVPGWGFVPTGDAGYEQVMSVSGADSNPDGIEASVVSATATSMVVRFSRQADHTTSISQDSSNPDRRSLRVNVVIDNTGGWDQGQVYVDLDSNFTPHISSAPTSLPSPDTGSASIDVSWFVLKPSEFEALSTGSPSKASVELQSGPNVYACTNTTVSSSSVQTDRYSETTSCTLPAYLPSSEYTVWVVAEGTSYLLGSGFASQNMSVPLEVSSVSHSQSSAAGGLPVTISGLGFSTDPEDVTVTFSNSNTAYNGTVLSSSNDTLVVRTPRVPEALNADTTLNIVITPTRGAPATTTSYDMTFKTGLAPSITNVSPNRGSTAGGTTITVTASSTFAGTASEYRVTIGDPDGSLECTDISLSGTELTCVTPAPVPRVFEPRIVYVFRESVGWAECGDISDPLSTPCHYEYIDLWSRRTTWGGNAPPKKGDSVFVPAGNRVLLDVSPPELNAIVLQGHLEFDSSASEELLLRCKIILVNGGSLSIGSVDTPFPGKARIQMLGKPSATQLPLYGNKVLALRNGTITMHGKHKTPTWTKLAQTADVGARSVTVMGDVSTTWEQGDQIVIGSSSVFGTDSEEQTIRRASYDPTTDTTRLDLYGLMEFTHLGEVVTVDGRDLDMRTEVAVLTRNVVFEGDEQSSAYAHGATIMIHTHGDHPRAMFMGEQIQLRRSGQAFRLGRYSLHWHLHGDVKHKQYLRGSTVSEAFNRAVTIHGTHNVNLTDNVAFNVMGHTFFLEDGIEQGNFITGNLGMRTRPSNALLNTDTTPAVFWITHPNNTVSNNVGSGSTRGYGFWYRFLTHPEGPSHTTSVCPKFSPLKEFSNNVAHSNMFYGLRIHPEFYPKQNPCGSNPLSGFHREFQQRAAIFDGLTSYKNGMKGAIATQVGLIQFNNFTLFDNGGGPQAHIVNGKDNGANMELTWILDDRNRDEPSNTSPVPSMPLKNMAGMFDSILVAKTSQGLQGTAGRGWMSGRKVTGVIMHSQVEFNPKHSALATLSNITFVGYDGADPTNGFYAVEACGKCKTHQGGAFTFMSGIKFIQDTTLPALSDWSWPHQGVFLDTDGSFLNSNTLPSALIDTAGFSVGVPGTTWQSSVANELFDGTPEDCVYTTSSTSSNSGMFCGPHLKFRRLMLNSHKPSQLEFRNIWVTDRETNKSSYVFFTHYNDDGYQFVVPTQRDFWVHWDVQSSLTNGRIRVDPSQIRIHRPDLLDDSSYVYITTSNVQEVHRYEVNGRSTVSMNYSSLPDPADENTQHGDAVYNRTFVPDTWLYGDNMYNHTLFTMIALGPDNDALKAEAKLCPPEGCNNQPGEAIDDREGILLWSDPDTWTGEFFPDGKPQAGDNVTIPFGWNLVIDEDPAPINMLDVQGNVTFSRTKDITLNATYVLVTRNGHLWAGKEGQPHPAGVTINLDGTRQTTDFVISEDFNLGSKVLSAFDGGRITMYGKPMNKRWLKLAATAEAGDTTLTLTDGSHGWSIGDTLLLPSSSYNPRQAEFAKVSGISSDGLTITLAEPLQHSHSAMVKEYSGSAVNFDARTEVASVSSNILITAADGETTRGEGGEAFGCHMMVQGNGYAQLSHASFRYGGQLGFRPTITFMDLKEVPQRDSETGSALTDDSGETITMANPSFVDSSVLLNSMHGALWIMEGIEPINITNNVMFEAYDNSAIKVMSTGNLIKGNLVVNVIKEMAGKSGQDIQMVSNFEITVQPNFLVDNVAAGSERMGFQIWGPSCVEAVSLFSNNTAHSTLGGLWLEASSDAKAAQCTGVDSFTTYLHWDFGVITVKGIPTSLEFEGLVVGDSKHKGLLPLVKSGNTLHSLEVRVSNSLFIGESRPEVCTMCAQDSDPGCAPKLSRQSYNKASPFGPTIALLHGVFAMKFTPGPEKKPYDELKGYATVHGITKVSGTTFADFKGSSGCGGGSYALGNHNHAPDASHPVYLENSNVDSSVASGALFYMSAPDPGWRNEADCGFQEFPPLAMGDNIELENVDIDYVLKLNCAGPKHAFFMDKDGSLTGVAGSVNGAFDQERKFPYDQGTPVLKGPCTYSTGWNAYQCRQEDDAWLHDPTARPEPAPPGSYFSQPQLFVLESRDADTESRNFGPVHFSLADGTSVDLPVAAMDQGWCFAYTCQLRLSTFWTYIPTFHTTLVNFTGSPPKVMRLNYPYVGPEDETIFVVNMKGRPERRFVWLDQAGPESNSYPVGRVSPLDQPPTIGDGTPHGAYHWNQFTTELTVKMKGGANLEIRKERAIEINTKLAVSVSDFFDSLQDKFLEAFAFAMGIPMSRFQIVSIVPGSTVIDARAYDSPDSYGTQPDPPMNQNVTELTQSDPDFVVPNITERVSAAPTNFNFMLQSFSDNVKSGTLETELGVKIEGISVNISDTEGVSDEEAQSMQDMVSSINGAGNETTLSSSRYNGEEWGVAVTILVDTSYQEVNANVSTRVTFKNDMNEYLAKGLYNLNNSIMSHPDDSSQPCYNCVLAGSLSEGSQETLQSKMSSRRSLQQVQDPVQVTMTAGLSDGLTKKQFQAYLEKVKAATREELLPFPAGHEYEGKVYVLSVQSTGSDDPIGFEDNDDDDDSSGGNDAGKIAGGVVGGVVGFLVVIVLPVALGVWLWHRKKSQKSDTGFDGVKRKGKVDTVVPTDEPSSGSRGTQSAGVPVAEREFSNIFQTPYTGPSPGATPIMATAYGAGGAGGAAAGTLAHMRAAPELQTSMRERDQAGGMQDQDTASSQFGVAPPRLQPPHASHYPPVDPSWSMGTVEPAWGAGAAAPHESAATARNPTPTGSGYASAGNPADDPWPQNRTFGLPGSTDKQRSMRSTNVEAGGTLGAAGTIIPTYDVAQGNPMGSGQDDYPFPYPFPTKAPPRH